MERREFIGCGGHTRSRCPSTIGAAVGCAGVVVWWAMAAAGWACDTPVYRYAMYRWTPMAYEVFYFHRKAVPQADQAIHAALADRDKDGVAPNVSVTPVDLDRKDALEALPDSVRKTWQDVGDKTLPRYVVVAPWGDPLFTGPIDLAAARQIVESPLRSEIGQRFHEGHGIVLLILEGDQPEETARMETVARRVMSIAAAGRLFADSPEDSGPTTSKDDVGRAPPSGDAASADGPGALRSAIRVALLKLNRSNAAETWLLKCLAAMTPDAQDLKPPYEPMLFAIYGRGRVMPPGIGKEVTVESLTGLLRFLGDRCSCTIKDQNPGLDLLMRWDWEATAERFAAEEEATPGPPLYAEMSADGSVSPPAKGNESGAPPTAVAAVISPSPSAGDPSAAASPGPSQQDPVPTAGTLSPDGGVPNQARAAERFSSRQRWQLGLGLAGMAFVVLAVGLILVRRQQHASS